MQIFKNRSHLYSHYDHHLRKFVTNLVSLKGNGYFIEIDDDVGGTCDFCAMKSSFIFSISFFLYFIVHKQSFKDVFFSLKYLFYSFKDLIFSRVEHSANNNWTKKFHLSSLFPLLHPLIQNIATSLRPTIFF